MSKFTDLEVASLGADRATDERALFELEYAKCDLRRNPCDGYCSLRVDDAWQGWQDRAKFAAVPASEPDRLFMEHGLWHDRKTGQHMYTQDQYDEEGRACLAEGKQNAMPAAAPAPVSGMPDLAELQLYNIDEILRGDRTLKYVKFYKAADVERLLNQTGATK